MKIDYRKASLALSAGWILVSIPISEHLYREAFSGSFLMRVFSLFVVASPVWLHYGLKWLTDEATLHLKYLLGLLVLGCGIAFVLSRSRYWDELTYIPLTMSLFLALLSRANHFFSVSNIDGSILSKRQSSDVDRIAPDKLKKLEAIQARATPLLEITQVLATDIVNLIQARGGRSPNPALIHADADSVKLAYSLVYAAYMQNCFKNTAHRQTAILVMYQAAMTQNLIPLIAPRIPNIPPLSKSEMEAEPLRASVRELIKLFERYALESIANIDSKRSNPLLPIYQNLRPFFSPATTDDQLVAMFDREFNEFFAAAQKEVVRVL